MAALEIKLPVVGLIDAVISFTKTKAVGGNLGS